MNNSGFMAEATIGWVCCYFPAAPVPGMIVRTAQGPSVECLLHNKPQYMVPPFPSAPLPAWSPGNKWHRTPSCKKVAFLSSMVHGWLHELERKHGETPGTQDKDQHPP